MPCRLLDTKSFPEDSQVTCSFAQPIYNCNFIFHKDMYTILVSLVSSTCLLPTTFTNVHKSCFHMSLAQNVHKCSQILFPHVSCPEHSQMFTDPIFICLLPRTFTNVHKCSQILFPHVSCPKHSQIFTNLHKSCFHMSLAQNIHKSSQIHVSCPEHSQIFTNLHKSCFHMSLAQNIHKCSQIFTNLISTCLLPSS